MKVAITDYSITNARTGKQIAVNYSTLKDNGDIIIHNNTRMMNVVDDELIEHIEAIEAAAKAYVEEAENDNEQSR